jgi:hypothetical protein
MDKLQNAMDLVTQHKGEPKYFICHPSTRRAILEALDRDIPFTPVTP